MKANKRDAEAFCNHCEWIHECWSMNLAMDECVTTRHALWIDPEFRNVPEHHVVCYHPF